ncbi:helix-turn-helix transcriptional regulator [Phenylobacterium sp.]|uniref:helix-turn-helix domain-containing protein n=1 Tax=Phenylobacterium sp. TaxID=1871053 RepID=UPI00345A1EEC
MRRHLTIAALHLPVRITVRSQGATERKSLSAFSQHIAQRVRSRRRQLNMTQHALGHACGLSAQQIQKCESGAVELSAARLWLMSKALKTDILYFFADFEGSRKQ